MPEMQGSWHLSRIDCLSSHTWENKKAESDSDDSMASVATPACGNLERELFESNLNK